MHCRIRKVKGIDVDALLFRGRNPDVESTGNRRALEDASQHIASSLTSHHYHHEESCFAEYLVTQASIQGKNRDLDKTEAGIVKDGRQPNDLTVGDEVIGA
ncbi:unnamed protein product [Fusarium graminearum]|nr:unnamed protein product [Fusarium graminearum]